MPEYNLLVAPPDCDFLSLSPGNEDGLVFEKQHAYPGQFRMKTAKGSVDITLTSDALEKIAKESQRYIDNGNKCDLPVEHTTDPEKNRGQNTRFFMKKDSKGRDGLFTETRFRDKEAAKMASTAQTSLYVPPEYEDGAKQKYTRAATHVALTDNPVIPGLDGFTPIAASLVTIVDKKETTMPIKELAANIGLKLSDDVLSDEGKAFGAIELAFKNGQEAQDKADKGIEALTLELAEYKKLNPPKVDPVKVSKAQIAMLRENRELKLSSLVEKGNILTCVAKALEDIFCDNGTLTLSLSEDVEDNFTQVIDALRDNDAIKLSENTGPQAETASVLLDSTTNTTISYAQKEAARRKAMAS